jgi:hypothetical protein
MEYTKRHLNDSTARGQACRLEYDNGECSRGRVCHWVPISTERAQRSMRS